ncbi:MAG: protein translocase subunit SecD [Candidatus Delongbacteria bacterium]|jgi:preprotein translocase subunit SecD|nr:protein translocase subunit SecD [Candidatus Delongbacteria bacterium]
MKERNNMIRWIIFAALLSWAVYALIPTYRTYFSSEKAVVEKIKIKNDLIKAVAKQERGEKLTAIERKLVRDYKDKPEYLSLAEEEIDKLNEFEKQNLKSLRLGLDLQGGMHLVLEIDYEQLLKNKAVKKDKQLDDLLAEVKSVNGNNKEAYFEDVQRIFKGKNVLLSNYFGRSGDSNKKIIDNLDSAARKGIVTTLEVLRNRIDQFGIAEPSIQPRGKHRIIVELPGVKDEERATNLVNQAAFLEFKIVADNEILQQKIDDIDAVLKNKPMDDQPEIETPEAKEVTPAEEKSPETSETDAEDATKLFSDTDKDSAAAVSDSEADFAKNYPFKALLTGGRSGNILVNEKNRLKVTEILKNDNVRNILGNHEFVWKNKPEVYNEEQFWEIMLVEKKAVLDGTSIVEATAQLSQSSASGGWEVPFELDRDGARIFSEVTGKNVGKRLAIILDNKLYMAPNIQVRIPNGRGVITLGGGTTEEAQDIAIVLKAGALEAPLEIMEKRVIGPSLGGDSIRSGVISAAIGFGLVVVFMIFWYKLSGLFAVIALFLNFIFTLATLGMFKGTLTLPGIAGLILTMGMAVDANIIIFERIKEEMGEKNTMLNAINAGYERAFTTIFDSNLTTFIAGITLYQFGTGAVKGFALTLMIGIMWSMFTAVVVTRLLSDLYVNKNTKKLSI